MEPASDPMLEKQPSDASSRKAVVLRYFSSTVVMAAGLLAHTVGLIVLARALGPREFGLLAIITSVSNLGLAVCGLGCSEILRRKVARDPSAYAAALGHALLTLSLTSVSLSVIIALGLGLFIAIDPAPVANAALILLLVFSNISMFAWIGLSEQILLAQENLLRANLVNISSGLGRAASAVLACLVFDVTDVGRWAYWHFGFYAVVSLLCIAAIWQYGRPRLGFDRGELSNGATISATGLLMALRQNADVLALSAVASPAVIGIYSISRRIVSTASVVSASLDRLVYANLSRAGKHGVASTFRLALRYTRYSAALCLAASLALYVAAPLVPTIFGDTYAEGVEFVRILCWLLVLTGLHYLAYDALNASDQHKHRLLAEVVSGIAGLAILAALTLAGDIRGIIAATYIASALVVAALWLTLYRLARNDERRSPQAELTLTGSG